MYKLQYIINNNSTKRINKYKTTKSKFQKRKYYIQPK